MSAARRLWLATALGMVASSLATAQTVQVRSMEARSRKPTPGALVSLRDQAGRILVQALADARGHVTLRAPRAGSYFVRVDRIGYLGVTLGPVTLTVGETLALDAATPETRVSLPDLAVVSRAAVDCRLEADAGEVVATLWAEARKALVGSELTNARPPLLEVTRYERSYGPEGSVVDETSSRVRSRGEAPFVAAEPERLARRGFYERMGTDHLFYAPDARVLLSEEFLRNHCFQAVAATDDSLSIGLAFAPTARHGNRIDVSGTLWLDRQSAELRRIDFQYTNVDTRLRSGAEQGRIDFVRLPDGEWVVGRWRARVGYRERGGEVGLLGADGASPTEGASVAGTVFDSLAGAPLAGAIVAAGKGYVDTTDASGGYHIRIPTEGDFTIVVSHPRFEQLNVPSLRHATAIIRGQEVRADFAVPGLEGLAARGCAHRPIASDSEGLLLGRIVDSVGRPRPGIVEATWALSPVLRAGYRLTLSDRGVRLTVPSDGSGRFTVCGVPAGIEIGVSAVGHDGHTERRTASAGTVVVLELTVPPSE